MRLYFITLFTLAHFFSSFALANSGGSISLEDGRLKVQLGVQKEDSRGLYQLRSILELHGFQNEGGFENEGGFVKTGEALAPLEIYNYLYDNGHYVFTIYLPVDDEKLFVSFAKKGFLSFKGIAARKLFEVVKLYVPRKDINNLEQYQWTDHAYCDKTKSGPIKYRCFIDR